jgi:hypothetical protein
MKSEISFNPIANSSTDMSNNSDTAPLQRSDLRVLLHSGDEDLYSSNLTAVPPYDRPLTSTNLHDEEAQRHRITIREQYGAGIRLQENPPRSLMAGMQYGLATGDRPLSSDTAGGTAPDHHAYGRGGGFSGFASHQRWNTVRSSRSSFAQRDSIGNFDDMQWTIPIAVVPGKLLGLEISFLLLGPVGKVPARSHDTCQPTTDDHQILALKY